MVVSAPVKRQFILILTQDDVSAQPLTLRLRAHGHEVFIARSEDQAARTLLVHASDVILIDTWLDGGTDRFDHYVNKPVDATALAEFMSAHSDRRANGTRA